MSSNTIHLQRHSQLMSKLLECIKASYSLNSDRFLQFIREELGTSWEKSPSVPRARLPFVLRSAFVELDRIFFQGELSRLVPVRGLARLAARNRRPKSRVQLEVDTTCDDGTAGEDNQERTGQPLRVYKSNANCINGLTPARIVIYTYEKANLEHYISLLVRGMVRAYIQLFTRVPRDDHGAATQTWVRLVEVFIIHKMINIRHGYNGAAFPLPAFEADVERHLREVWKNEKREMLQEKVPDKHYWGKLECHVRVVHREHWGVQGRI